MLNQNGDGREGNRLQSKSGPKRSCNRSGTVPECKRPKKTGSYQSSPVFSLFGNLPEPVRVRLPSWDAKKPDRTGLSNTIQEPYIDFNGKSRANRQWITVYPNTHNEHPQATRAVILVNTNKSTDAWKQIPFQHPDITAIEITGEFGMLESLTFITTVTTIM